MVTRRSAWLDLAYRTSQGGKKSKTRDRFRGERGGRKIKRKKETEI